VSIKIMVKVWEDSVHNGSKLLLMLALADHASEDGVCWPGIASLSRKVRLGERYVMKLLPLLEESGELYIARKMGRGNTNLYYITLGFDQATMARTLNKRLGLAPEQAAYIAGTLAVRSKKGVLQDTVLPENGGDSGSGKGELQEQKVASSSVKGGPQFTRIIMDPHENRHESSPEISGDALLDQFFGPRPDRIPQQIAPGANVADPVQAGGADSCADTLVDAVCRFNGLTQGSASLPEKKRIQMVRKADGVLQEWGGGAIEQVRLAWQAWTVRCGWHKQADMFYESFANEFGMLLLAVRDGTVTVEILRKEVEDAKAKQNGGNNRGTGDHRPPRRERGRWTAEDAARINAKAAAELAAEQGGHGD